MKKTVVALVTLAAAAFVPSAAQASGGCPDEPPSSQAFLGYDGDPDYYFLAPGGGFDSGGMWNLDDGAYLANGMLVMPKGSEAVSPPICVREGYPHGRMYAAGTNGLLGGLLGTPVRAKLEVEVIYDGDDSEDSNRYKFDSRTLTPTDRFALDETAFGLDPVTGNASVRLVFESEGSSTVLIDNVYIDPRARI